MASSIPGSSRYMLPSARFRFSMRKEQPAQIVCIEIRLCHLHPPLQLCIIAQNIPLDTRLHAVLCPSARPSRDGAKIARTNRPPTPQPYRDHRSVVCTFFDHEALSCTSFAPLPNVTRPLTAPALGLFTCTYRPQSTLGPVTCRTGRISIPLQNHCRGVGLLPNSLRLQDFFLLQQQQEAGQHPAAHPIVLGPSARSRLGLSPRRPR
jgi:hypothetical protein